MTFTAEQVKAIQEAAKVVCEHTLYQTQKNEAEGIPEFIACEIIDLTEWCSPEVSLQGPVAKLVLDSCDWPQGVAMPVKAHFGLPY